MVNPCFNVGVTGRAVKTLFQCDFDGTITREDASFLILDAFGSKDWRQLFQEYVEGKISVGRFNMTAFARVKADEPTLIKLVQDRVKIRPGLHNLLACCDRLGFEFVIVSNGLDFYIQAILRYMGISGIKVFAARTRFGPDGIEARYLGPEGNVIEDGFKESHLRLFQSKGYRIIYIGNGVSDVSPARQAYGVFATGDLLACCSEMGINCMPFNDFNDIVRDLPSLLQVKNP